MKKRLRISKGGQISVPAEIRHRWGTSTVIAQDRGEELVLSPAPDDPIDALAGIFAPEAKALRDKGISPEDIRRESREEEAEAEDRRWGRT